MERIDLAVDHLDFLPAQKGREDGIVGDGGRFGVGSEL